MKAIISLYMQEVERKISDQEKVDLEFSLKNVVSQSLGIDLGDCSIAWSDKVPQLPTIEVVYKRYWLGWLGLASEMNCRNGVVKVVREYSGSIFAVTDMIHVRVFRKGSRAEYPIEITVTF